MKTCSHCKITKKLEDFYNDKRLKYGKSCRCKLCSHISFRKSFEKNRERYRQVRLKWIENNKERYDEIQRVAQRKYNLKYPEKLNARAQVQMAVLKGKLTKMACEKCGNLLSEAHHPNYDQPLNIWWLCKTHHRIADKGELKLYV